MSSLVSVIIATYNSSSFVAETLESVAKQSWKEIELILTDDCSIDNTVDICRQWLHENRHRFVSAEIITSKKNTGVSANVNRGLNIAKGEWIKFLGADDTLKTDCIEANMAWIALHPEVKVLFSRIEIYKNTFVSENLIDTSPGLPHGPYGILTPGRSADSQYKMLLLSDRIHFTPSVFVNRETLLSVGGFDERFKLLEDYPLWLNLTKNGHKLCFMENITVNYRRHSKAINNTGIDYLINPSYFKTEEFRKKYTYPYLPADIRLNQRFYWYASQIFRCNWLNKNHKPNSLFLAILTSLLNPFRYFIWLRKIINKDLKNNEFYT